MKKRRLFKNLIRPIYRVFKTFSYFMYDYFRFFMYGGYSADIKDSNSRNYLSVMVYHSLEKSLSYKNRDPSSGWGNAIQLLEIIESASYNNSWGYHDIAAVEVLKRFILLPENLKDPRGVQIQNKLKKISLPKPSTQIHGAIDYSDLDYNKGVLQDPESFFLSRYSLREFKDEVVSDLEIERAVKLAMKTPSVCNRQAWAIYHSSSQEVKDILFKFQQGNRPFGKKVPNVILVSIDLEAFFSPQEHYQHWIDGGLLSMSLMYAFHSIGIATCPLNWSAKPSNDIGLRKKLNVKDNHTIIMALAVGYPATKNKVCASTRRPIEEVFFKLDKK